VDDFVRGRAPVLEHEALARIRSAPSDSLAREVMERDFVFTYFIPIDRFYDVFCCCFAAQSIINRIARTTGFVEWTFRYNFPVLNPDTNFFSAICQMHTLVSRRIVNDCKIPIVVAGEQK
jgi:hypothetical protein